MRGGTALSLVVALVALGPATARAAERCGSPLVVDGAPAVVFIVMDGNHSEQPETGRAYPVPVANPSPELPVVSNYCPIAPDGSERRFPPGMDAGLRRMASLGTDICQPGGGLDTDSCLLARVADAGAVVLPYSYAGSRLEPGPGGAVFHFDAYYNRDSIQPPAVSVARLEAMVASIERTWPATAIVIGAHSLSGMFAEAMWEERAKARALGNLVRVYTWDSTINGVQNCLFAGAITGDITGETIGSSREVANEWCRRWNERDALDQRIIELSRDGSFVATAVPNDPTYAHTFAGGELRVQLVYRCPDDGSRADSPCIAEPPSLLGRAPECDAAGPGLYGATGHELVRACPEIVRHQLATVLAATSDRMAVAAGCGAAPQVRPSRILLNCRRRGTVVRRIRWTAWGHPSATGTGVLRCRGARSRCALGSRSRVRVKLSKLATCARTHRFQYRVARVRPGRAAQRPRTTITRRLGCRRPLPRGR